MMALEQLVDQMHLEDLRNQSHPSVLFDEHEEYDLLIIRFPVLDTELKNVSLGFIITQESSYYYDLSQGSFKKLEERFEGPYQMIDKMLDDLLKAFNKYEEKIIDMEEELYTDRHRKTFMTHWLGLKRDLVRIERNMFRSSTVLQNVITRFERHENFPIYHYRDIHEHSERLLRSSTLQLSKLDYLYNFYNTRTNEKMNRLIFFLTIISAIFLPLNLIVGFFGMNTTDLPFSKAADGTMNVVIIIILLTAITSLLLYLWGKKNNST